FSLDTDWSDVIVTSVGRAVTLPCVDWPLMGFVTINWKRKSPGMHDWKLVLSASEKERFFGSAAKAYMQLADSNFHKTGNFSLRFAPQSEDEGRYSCLISQQKKKLREKIILLVILTVSVFPSSPVPQQSTLLLTAEVSPGFAISRVTWLSPGGTPLRMAKTLGVVVAKLPQIRPNDQGKYICHFHPRGNSSTPLFPFSVDVAVHGVNVVSFTNITHGVLKSTASVSQYPLTITCSPKKGDYVLLYWRPPDKKSEITSLIYEYDRWRDRTTTPQLSLDGLKSSPKDGLFSFLVHPRLNDGGLYICEVFLDDTVFSQRTQLSILQVNAGPSLSCLVLTCQYTERSQVKQVLWKHQNKSRTLNWSALNPGRLSTEVVLPPTKETAGIYTCSMELKNGLKIKAVYTITLPPKENTESPGSVSPPYPESNSTSFLPSLSALLLLVPLVAAVAGVLLLRQKTLSRRGIEQSLSHYSGEVENIYENPEDVRQASPQSSVYMDLKPRGDDDVYKELDRYKKSLNLLLSSTSLLATT
uniref:Ig-like domain-containing protein n=1 Tax=Esox lucius TaxID=8010 RepID=A0A3P8XMB3_ESOLU